MTSVEEPTGNVTVQSRALLERGAFGMPKPQGWTIERITSLMTGILMITSQIARSRRSGLLRLFAGWVGANLVLNGIVGWCGGSVIMHRLGVPTAVERALGDRSGYDLAGGKR
jgi:hypothetical protein